MWRIGGFGARVRPQGAVTVGSWRQPISGLRHAVEWVGQDYGQVASQVQNYLLPAAGQNYPQVLRA